MKRTKRVSWILTIVLIISMFPLTAFADSSNKVDLSKADVILETSDPEIGLAFFIQDEVDTRAYQSKTRTGSGYFYKTANNERIADFSCTGTFSYDGTICNVTKVSTSVWNTIDGYRVEVAEESKNQISPTYARATGVFNLYNLSSNAMTSSATINVFCNQNGSTSVEFNSDDD